MFSIEALKNVKILVTHMNCPDGTASAMLIKNALPDVEVRFVQHGTIGQPQEAVPGMLYCDMSPPKDRFQEFIAAGTLVLDHHKAAKPIVEAFGANGIFGDEVTEPGVSGAVLAYRHVWKPLLGEAQPESLSNAAEFAILVGIRDTWQRTNPLWEDACVVSDTLRFFPEESWLERENPFAPSQAFWWKQRTEIGELVLQKHFKSVQNSVDKAYRFTTAGGNRVVMFQGLSATSDAAEALGSEADLVIGFMYEVEAGVMKLIYSTRSHTNFDCCTFCQSLGGGGHTRAAGFSLPVQVENTPNPFALAKALIEKHESGSTQKGGTL